MALKRDVTLHWMLVFHKAPGQPLCVTVTHLKHWRSNPESGFSWENGCTFKWILFFPLCCKGGLNTRKHNNFLHLVHRPMAWRIVMPFRKTCRRISGKLGNSRNPRQAISIFCGLCSRFEERKETLRATACRENRWSLSMPNRITKICCGVIWTA